ncbi:N-acetylglucosamine-6-phosphate deacetylase [Pseudonocardia sp. Ae168_Ps1]|uniref:N-acetylglucosamine-6-phosphate deacetylase n=1 Tax=unclassified Pseudonocardia TaxID=2619320 RepID=UPI000967B71C|nr:MULTISPECIES: amidohydrolase family protein [unclassified Pseudonocardia]OLL72144.1 N-acetylglucosamine-6-phosphate deacetylase [Pseudonocardia sp. Ae150A_Ps1]OLL78111.1 N-acetylglucosamine-6-phosphate deacetylase [Pseudonocardia sp. Ae168_Ps1]OLL87765.1 N-acetylglucosamine-6-phosphate deacetylase [Pseudonocardia sp. Ae263_Ps1]OLL92209.1 N-acetylglucosamine-6-phosphate deacetylase [Pseudonocardia sp. Ae356_Ps1]
MSLLVAAETLATGTGDGPGPGWVELGGGRVTAAGSGPPPREPDRRAAVVVPGFVDLHCHGGGGAAFGTDTAEAARVAAFHAARGTTTMLASLVTLPRAELLDAVRALRPLVDDGVVAGVHLEGPWLAASRCGAHDPALLRDPDPAELEPLLATGAVAVVTVAPELPGGLAAIEQVHRSGVLAAVGHTAAGYDLTRRAIDAGARLGTHLFNAMAPLHHRDPGPVAALLADPRAAVELITDGVHVHPALWEIVDRAAPGRVAAVTDAMAAAGMPDGGYRLGALDVRVDGGVARLADGTIAGSTATADALFRRIVAAHPGPLEAALARAVAWTSTIPAHLLGHTGAGRLDAGARADLVLLSDDLVVEGVLRGGAPVT